MVVHQRRGPLGSVLSAVTGSSLSLAPQAKTFDTLLRRRLTQALQDGGLIRTQLLGVNGDQAALALRGENGTSDLTEVLAAKGWLKLPTAR